jgi:hypothetical protein
MWQALLKKFALLCQLDLSDQIVKFSKYIHQIGLQETQNEMVQGPCAHVVLHYVDFTDLLTVIEFT